MYLTIKKRLELLMSTDDKLRKGVLKFDPQRAHFGFKRLEQLFPVDLDQIKGFPTVLMNRSQDHMKFAAKIIPLENKYDEKAHPSRLEGVFLKEFTKLVRNMVTPHITYYFMEMDVKNNAKALTPFPFKELRYEIERQSTVLFTEFVSGGSLEEYIQVDSTATIADGVWKYVIFAMVWTLFILQDKYRFMHNDFHYGNVLIDTCLSSTDRTPLEYKLTIEGKEPVVYQVPNLAVLPKVWDTEFSNAYRNIDGVYPNRFGQKEDNIPSYFNPVYDLHCFLVSLLEMNLPTSITSFILSLYPPELIPELPTRKHRSFGDDSSSESGSEEGSVEEDADFSMNDEDRNGTEHSGGAATRTSDDVYWKTDETMTSSNHGTEEGDEEATGTQEISDEHDGTDSDSDGSQIRTEFLLGDRMLNGAETKFPNLPTPYSLLSHPFFSDYVVANGKGRKPCVSFSYSTRYDAAIDVPAMPNQPEKVLKRKKAVKDLKAAAPVAETVEQPNTTQPNAPPKTKRKPVVRPNPTPPRSRAQGTV